MTGQVHVTLLTMSLLLNNIKLLCFVLALSKRKFPRCLFAKSCVTAERLLTVNNPMQDPEELSNKFQIGYICNKGSKHYSLEVPCTKQCTVNELEQHFGIVLGQS